MTMTHIREYRLLPGVVRYTFVIFGLFTTPNLCPLAQNPGDATGLDDFQAPRSGVDFWSITRVVPVSVYCITALFDIR